jgi:hypothetical protein
MARLASQAKAGFYPTPDKVCDLLSVKLEIEEGARLLDPCCGKGKTLSRLGAGGVTYGIELDHERAQESRARLHKVIWGDALTEVRISPMSFNLLYLNPPYDAALAADGKEKRLEEQFLRKYMGNLIQDGYLLFVIPYYVLKHCAKPLSRYFRDVQVFSFPESDFGGFKQCVVTGRKRKLIPKKEALDTQEYLEKFATLLPEFFLSAAPPLEDMPEITIPAAQGPLKTFQGTKVDPLEAIPLIRKAGIMSGVLEELAPRKNNHIRPLNPLENGHMALMLAGGYMNGAVQKEGRQLVIKGVVDKSEEIVKSSGDGTGKGTITTRDQYKPTVKVIDLQAAEIFTIQ